jgi:hypothetical protein
VTEIAPRVEDPGVGGGKFGPWILSGHVALRGTQKVRDPRLCEVEEGSGRGERETETGDGDGNGDEARART